MKATKTFIMLQNIYISYKLCSFNLYCIQRAVVNIDNNKKCFLRTKSSASEGSRDTE